MNLPCSYGFIVYTKSYTHQSPSSPSSSTTFKRDDNFTECRNHQAIRNRFQETSIRMNIICFLLLLDKLNAS